MEFDLNFVCIEIEIDKEIINSDEYIFFPLQSPKSVQRYCIIRKYYDRMTYLISAYKQPCDNDHYKFIECTSEV